METFLLFASGGGGSDPLNWSQDEAILLSSTDLISIRPTSSRTLEMTFNEATVILTVKNGSHVAVMKAIAVGINSQQKAVTIADFDANMLIHRDIRAVEINPSVNNYIQRITNNSRTELTVPRGKIKNCMIANVDGTDAVACTLELYEGTVYTKLLDQLSIPAKSTLVLEPNEISFDDTTYTLHATSGDAAGKLTFTFNY
tara:strand:- start:2464 stop:3063 length:600 start_codon:yes stop_codon:yes gene_type:complete